MILSVSMLSPRNGSAVPLTDLMRSIAKPELPDVDHFPGDGCRCDHCRAHQERPPHRTSLPSFEIAVRR